MVRFEKGKRYLFDSYFDATPKVFEVVDRDEKSINVYWISDIEGGEVKVPSKYEVVEFEGSDVKESTEMILVEVADECYQENYASALDEDKSNRAVR